MKFKTPFFQMLIGCFVICFTLSVHAQSTSLVYKVKGKNKFSANIDFTGESGSADLSPNDFFQQSNIYFTLNAYDTRKGFFKEADIEKILSKVSLLQNEQSISQSGSPRSLLNSDSRIDRIIIAFPKSDMTTYDEFSFSVDGLFSEKVSLDEKYFEEYQSAKTIFEEALEAYEKNQFIDSYKSLFSLYTKSLTNPEIKAMSFYGKMLEIIEESVDAFVKDTESHLEALNQNFIDEGSEIALNDFKVLAGEIESYLMEFEDYLESDLDGVKPIAKRIVDLKTKTEKQFEDNIQLFKDKKMALLEESDYTNYQYNIYIHLISRMLLDVDSLWIIDSIKPIKLDKAEAFVKDYSALYEAQKQEFLILVSLINDNIEKGFIFSDKVMNKLDENKDLQKQPYFEIFTALNALETDKDKFEDYLKIALSKCTDEVFIKGIELWQLSYILTKNEIGLMTLKQINKGAELIAKKRWSEAEDLFNMLARQVSGFAPIWYYSGELKYNMGESFSAEVQFKRALSIYPEYIAPRKFIFEIFEKGEFYDQLLENAEEAISTFDIWLFRYYKAKALVYLKKYNLAIDELLNFCLTKNKWDTNQYFLLGDAYLALNKFDEAKAAYTKTQEINPFALDTKRFDDKMGMVFQKEKEHAQVKQVSSSDSTSLNK